MGGGPFAGSRRQAPGEPPERAGSGRSSTSTIGIPAAGGLRLAAAGHSQIVLRQSDGLSRLAYRDPCNSRMLRYPPASRHKSHRGNCRPAPAGKSSSKHTPMLCCAFSEAFSSHWLPCSMIFRLELTLKRGGELRRNASSRMLWDCRVMYGIIYCSFQRIMCFS